MFKQKSQFEEKLIKEYLLTTEKLKRLTAVERFSLRYPVQVEFIRYAFELTSELRGDVWEFGYGSGRTYELIRKLAGKSNITVFDRSIDKKSLSKIDSDVIIGDFFDTIPSILKEKYGSVKILHADIGTTNYLEDLNYLSTLPQAIDPYITDGGIIICDRPVTIPQWDPVKNAHASNWPYYMWIKVASST